MSLRLHLCHCVDQFDVPESVRLVVHALNCVGSIVHLSTTWLLGIHFLGGNQLHKSIDSHRSTHVLHLAHWARCCVGCLDAEVAAELLRAQRAMVPVGHALLLIPSLLILLLNTSIQVFFIISKVALRLVWTRTWGFYRSIIPKLVLYCMKKSSLSK